MSMDKNTSDNVTGRVTRMMEKKFFSDDRGNPSSIRMMSMLSLVVAATLAFVEVFGWGSGEGNTELVLYFLVAAFAPKAVQKFAEMKR